MCPGNSASCDSIPPLGRPWNENRYCGRLLFLGKNADHANKGGEGVGFMTAFLRVDCCANANCRAKFKRLSEGTTSVFAINKPELWGLPASTKQKVVWLCAQCSSSLDVRIDYRHHVIQLVHKERQVAA